MTSKIVSDEKIPITIVPTKKLVEEKEAQKLLENLRVVQTSIRGLQNYSETLSSTPRRKNREDIEKESTRLRNTLKNMKLDSAPILGERFQNELEMIEQIIHRANEKAKEGDLVGASALLKEAHSKILTIGTVFEIEMRLLLSGRPENIDIPGYPNPDEAYNAMLDGIEASLMDIGTINDQRGRNIIALGEKLAKNAYLLNIDNDQIITSRNNAYVFIIERGHDAKEKIAYTKNDHKTDSQFISSFDINIPKIKRFMLDETVSQIRSWQLTLQTLVAQHVNDEAVKKSIQNLQKDLERFRKRVVDEKKVNIDELRLLTLRYRTMTGTNPQKSKEEIEIEIFNEATRLRGSSRVLKEESKEWFANIALEALQNGKTDLAKLALFMASLQESSKNKGRQYLQEFQEIKEVLVAKADFTPGMASRYSRSLEVGVLDSQIDNLKKEAKGSKRDRIENALNLAKSKLMNGMIEGAAKIIEMISIYAFLAKPPKEMEEGIDLEIAGTNGLEVFNLGYKKDQFAKSIVEIRTATKGWKGKIIGEAISEIESLTSKSKITEAQSVLTLTAMYIEAMARNGGNVKSLSKEEQEMISIMENGIREKDEKKFMETYIAFQYSYTKKEADRLAEIAQKRGEGQETILDAINAARERAKKGNSQGANQLLSYVADYYGREQKGIKEGWRYRLQKVKGIDEGKIEMLEGIRMEIVSLRIDTSKAAAKRFDDGSKKIANTLSLLSNINKLDDKLSGKVPFVDGEEDTKGKIPIGEKIDGKYIAFVSISEVKKDINLQKLRIAAESGNLTLYNKELEAINLGLKRSAEKVISKRNTEKAVSQINDIINAFGEIQNLYGNEKSVSSFISDANKLLQSIKKNGFNPEEYSKFLESVSNETKIAKAFAVVKNQIELSEQYRKVVDLEKGELARQTAGLLRDSSALFLETKNFLVAGDIENAQKAYEKAISKRTDAILLYRAENSPSWKQIVSLRPGGTPRETERIGDTDLRFFSQYTASKATEEYSFYRDAHISAFSKLLQGTATNEEVNRIGRATAFVEASTFSIPQSTPAGLLNDFVPAQRRVLDASRAMLIEPAKNEILVAEATREIENMQKTLELNKFAINATLCSICIGTAFIPVIGPYVSGGLFTGLSIDTIATEYRVNGYASTESWAMLGLTVATVGLFATATKFAALAKTAVYIGETSHALRYSRIALGLSIANLGIAGYMSISGGYHAYKAFETGDYKNGVLMAGMSAFPWIVAGVSFSRSIAAKARLNARNLSPESLIEEIAIEIEEPAPIKSAKEISTPQTLFDYLLRLSKMPEQNRLAILAKLPKHISAKISSLLENQAIAKAIEVGKIDTITENSLFRAIKTFDLDTPPPSGPKGTRFSRDLSMLVSSKEALREFVASLMVSDEAPAPQLRKRAAARAMLEEIRQKSARAAAIIDDLLRNSAIRDAIENGDTQFSNRALDLAIEGRKGKNPRPGIKELIDPENIAAEKEAQVEFVNDMAVGSDLLPQAKNPERPLRIVASAEIPAQTQIQTQPGQTVQVVVQQNPGIGGRIVNGIGGIVKAARERRKAREAPTQTPNIERFCDTSKKQLDMMASLTVEESMRRAVIDEVTSTATLEEAPIIADSVRYGANRFAQILKLLYQRANSGSLEMNKRASAREAMVKIISHKNVKDVLELMSATDPELAKALTDAKNSAIGGAKKAGGTGGVSLESFLSMKSKEGFTDSEVLSIVETIEGRSGLERNQRIAQLTELENNGLPRLEAQLQSEIAKSTRKGTTPDQKRVVAIQTEIAKTTAKIQELREAINDPENQPLSTTEELFGIIFTSNERAPIFERLMEIGLIHPETTIIESLTIRAKASKKISELPTAMVKARGKETNHSAAEKFKELLAIEIREGTTQSVEEAMLRVLRSEKMFKEIENLYGRDMRNIYERSVKEGSIAQVVENLQRTHREGNEIILMDGLNKGLLPVIQKAQAAIEGDFALMNSLALKSKEISIQGTSGIGTAGERSLPLSTRLSSWWEGSNARNAFRFLILDSPDGTWRSFWPSNESIPYRTVRLPDRVIGGTGIVRLHTAGFRQAIKTYKTTRPKEAPLERAVSLGYAGLNLAALGIEAYYLNQWYGDKIWNIFTNSETIDEGIAIAKRDYGIDISKDNALWLMRDGKEFYYTLTNSLPVGSTRRPGNQQEFIDMLNKGGVIYDPYRLNEILDEGKAMENDLPRLNRLLKNNDPEAIEIFRSWGIDPEKIKGRTSITIAELVVLKQDDWRKKGLVVTFGDVVATQFCIDSGIIKVEELKSGNISEAGKRAVNFLIENKDVFAVLWDGVQKGHIPVAYFDDVISYLESEGTISGIRAVSKDNLDEILQKTLIEKGLFLQNPIKQGSFLFVLDRFGEYKVVEDLLKKYGEDSEAMEKFNNFTLLSGEYGEAIYGDPKKIANMVIEDPTKALENARKNGFVAPQRLVELDPRIKDDPELVRYVLDHSQMSKDGKQSFGMLDWIKNNEHRTKNHTKEIIEYVRSVKAIEQLTPSEVEEYLDRQAILFREKGWWIGATPDEARTASKAGKPVETSRPREVNDKSKMSREELLQYETEPKYPRRPGIEGVKQAKEQPKKMTDEEKKFFSTNEGFSSFIDGRIESMFEDAGPDGMQMKAQYGVNQDKAKEEIKKEIYRLLSSEDPKDKKIQEEIMKPGVGELASSNTEIIIGDKKYSYNILLGIEPMRRYIFEFVRRKNLERRGG